MGMKRTHFPVGRAVLALALSFASILPAQENLEAVYKQAVGALERGDFETTETLSRRILQTVPNHLPTKDLLSRAEQLKVAAARGAAKTKLAGVTLDRIHFDGTPFKDALSTLRTKLRQQKVEVNLLIMDPGNKFRESEVAAMELNQIPATAAIDYLAEAVGARVEYRADSVVFAPK